MLDGLNVSIVMSQSVRNALIHNQPVVALESTVLAHGLPYPRNLEVFHRLEALLWAADVVPATIIVLEGKAHVGIDELSYREIETILAHRDQHQVFKLGMRDIPYAFAKKLSGGTTVSATMRLAHLAGIDIFATGGIGGVHRLWQENLDISSDLSALARIPVTVVSAGCKAILDIPATLEVLETKAVPVLGWQCDCFPRFYTRESIHMIDSIANEAEFAAFHQFHQITNLPATGILIANPIPSEFELPSEQIDPFIEKGIAAARENNIRGKALTPFLLDFLAGITKGESVRANLALLENNVRLAALLAKALKG
ncbi:MAG: pseudouridine-5'-phosphate glycosidase [Candidatus Cloacimonadaceae bacterium]|nr:pseudouridine-5'-phosphate glycosidase [Candidatus Cloacimonadaceae bacterium]